MLADERAALDEQRELARGEPQHLAVVAPQLGERAPLQPLLKDAQAGAIPHEHLAELARLIHEQEHLAAQRVPPQPGLHQPVEAVVPFSKVDRGWVGEYADSAAGPEDHASPRRIAITSPIVRPSIRSPVGDTSTIVRSTCAGSATSTRRSLTGRFDGDVDHRCSVSMETPVFRTS